jgi:tetratricopeptide (TPR) repeat protein
MMIDWAKEDDQLRERLILYAARRAGSDAGAAAVRRAFEKAVRIRDFVPYREATGWARDVDRAIDSIEQLLNDGQAAAVIELCEASLRSLLDAVQRVDDSDGHFGELRDRLQDIHYRACQEARPDPAELAVRLFQWELLSDFDVFFGAVARYSKILGDEGMKVYRELAEAEWEKVPPRTARQERSEGGRHFRITHIMESLAKTSGDIEQLVAVMSRDLSSAYSYLKIAEVYLEAGRHDHALLWAEKGLEAFKERTDARLREFAAEEYHRRRRHDDAMKLIWAEFAERPFLDSYQTLERHAKKASAWSEWRERALAEIRLRITKAKDKARGQIRPRWMQAEGDNSQLVEIFLYEGNPEEAWREAQAGGCSDNLWLRLAAVREKEYPADAAPIYLKQADAAVATTRNGRYEDSVDLLMKAASVMRRIDAGKEFAAHLEALRVKYKIKRNFIKLIEQKRKSLYVS